MGIVIFEETQKAELEEFRRMLLSCAAVHRRKDDDGFRGGDSTSSAENGDVLDRLVCVTSGVSYLGIAVVNQLRVNGYSVRIIVDNEVLIMAPVFAKIKDINATKSDWALKLRLVRAYTIPVFRNPDQIQSFECVFRDVEGSTIRGSARAPHIESVRSKLQEGSLYIISYFMVSKDELRYKTATHTHKFSFYAKTAIRKIGDPTFPRNRFIFKSFDAVAMLQSEDEILLFDVIGRLVEMRSPRMLQTREGPKRLMEIELEDLSERRLIVTLWEEFVDKILPYYNSPTFEPVVVVLQFCRPKVFQETVKVSNTYNCTQLFINDDVWEISEYKKKIAGSPNVSRPVAITQSSGSGDTPSNEFATGRAVVRNLQELCEGEDGNFWVYCTIAEIENPSNVWYMACLSCHRKLSPSGTKYMCRQCGEVEGNENYRFKLEVRVMDETYNALLIVWDAEGQVIFGKTAQELKKEDDAEPGVLDYYISKLVDRSILFKVSRKTDNTRGSRVSYSVMKVTDDPELLARFCTSYVHSQESDLISKLGRTIKETDDGSSEDEVSTPDKKLKLIDGTNAPTAEATTVESDPKGKKKCFVDGYETDPEVKAKRRLEDDFSGSTSTRKTVKQEKP